ncbi:MAG: protein-L-isoaspartate(D-aspartate) O-methyltransferase [Chitinophagales bacterium]|nr:protein-L-isoaspartate(D-aspartate) O-methyltransferase [Chitinophagales bacterium]
MISKYRRAKETLIDTLKKKGISNTKILDAIFKIDRHLFIPDSALHSHAYEDKAFPIGVEQTISQPYTVAFQTELLLVNKGDKILEIGTGSGYQAAVLVALGADVYSIERQKFLYEKTKLLLNSLGYSNIKMYYGDGFKGKKAFAPYDKIIVTAAAPFVPTELLSQLKVGGILVIPVDNNDGSQNMMRLTKTSETEFKKEIFDKFAFVPMLKGTN